MMTPSDPRTAPDDKQEAVEDVATDGSGTQGPDNKGVSAEDPAEGADDAPEAGSAKG
jgi:hypothetical protein